VNQYQKDPAHLENMAITGLSKETPSVYVKAKDASL
jgi:hypothetical protein